MFHGEIVSSTLFLVGMLYITLFLGVLYLVEKAYVWEALLCYFSEKLSEVYFNVLSCMLFPSRPGKCKSNSTAQQGRGPAQPSCIAVANK